MHVALELEMRTIFCGGLFFCLLLDDFADMLFAITILAPTLIVNLTHVTWQAMTHLDVGV